MLQIPVEGGHKGADLIVRHELGDTKCDRQQDNDQKFYLSMSYLDSTHEISSVTEGWSLMMTFQLKWKKPVQVPAKNSSLPLYMSIFNTVRHLLSPLRPEKTEICDTDLLVIPLRNNYKNNNLSYNHLKGTDQLMACLLQSIDYLEVRLAFLKHYRFGYVQVQQRMNRNRDDDGYPESDAEEFEDGLPSIGNNTRFIGRIIEDSCSIEPYRHLNGSTSVNTEKSIPVCWAVDYIHGHIDGVEDLFDPVAAPNKEEYDDHDVEDPLLKQWYYKPVLIFWPKNSPMIKCRADFYGTVVHLKNSAANIKWTLSNESERKTKVMELDSIVNYFCHRYYKDGKFSNDTPFSIFFMLLKVCSSLKAKEAGFFLFNLNLSPIAGGRLREIIDPMEEFFSLFGWEACKQFFDEQLRYVSNAGYAGHQILVKSFLLPLISKLLLRDEPFGNEAATKIFHRICRELFQEPTESAISYETFSSLVPSASNTSENNFFVCLLVLEHRRLLHNCNNNWMSMAITYLTDLPIEQLNCTVIGLMDSTLLRKFKIRQMTTDCRKLLDVVCRRYHLHGDFHGAPFHPPFFCQLGNLFVFMENDAVLQPFIQMIFDPPAGSELHGNQLLKSTLNCYGQHNSEFVKKVKSFWTERLHNHRHHLVENLKALDAKPILSKGRKAIDTALAVLDNAIPSFIVSPPSSNSLTAEELRTELPNIIYIFKLCNDLKSKSRSLILFRAFACNTQFNWCDENVVAELARFISFCGWTASKGFVSTISRCNTPAYTTRFHFKLLIALLSRNDSLCNIAAKSLFPQLLIDVHLLPSVIISSEFFCNQISSMQKDQACFFLVAIVLMQHRKLLEAVQLMRLTKSYLETLPVQRLYSFFKPLNTALLLLPDFHMDETTPLCRTLVELVVSRLVEEEFSLDYSDVKSLHSLSKVVAWMEDLTVTQLWIDKIFSFKSTEEDFSIGLKSSLVLEEFFIEHSDFQLKKGRLQIAWDKHLHKYLNDNVSDLVTAFFKVGEDAAILKLDKIVEYLSTNPILGEESSGEEKEDTVLNFKTLLLFCRSLGAKEQGIRLLNSYAGCQGVDWCEASLLNKFAMFLNGIGLEACIKFIGEWLAGPNCNLKLLEKICSLSSPNAEVNLLAKNLMEAAEIQTNPNFIKIMRTIQQNSDLSNIRRRLRPRPDTGSTSTTCSKAKRSKKN